MAYYSYIEPLNDNLICCICRTPFIDPYCSRTCCHTFCRECITTALSISPTCPVDRSHLALDDLILADPLIRNLVNELPVECPNKVAGCEETPQRQLLDLHLRDACKHTDTRGNNVSHPNTEDERLKDAEDDEHPQSGESSTVRCEFCQEKVLRSESHTSCQDTIIPCTHAAQGCSWTGPRSELTESHISSCPYEAIKGFFSVHDQTLGKLKEENEVLKQRVSELEGRVRVLSKESRITKDVLGPWHRVETSRIQPVTSTPGMQSTDYAPALFPNFNNATYPEEAYVYAGQPAADQMASLASYFPSLEGDSGPSATSTVDTHSSRLPATTSYANRSAPFAHTSPSYQQASHPPLLPLPNPTISTSTPNVPIASSSLTPSSPVAPLNLSGNLFTTLTSLHNSVVTLSSSVDSLARQHDVHISTEAMRNNEELRSLRSVLHGLRMQVHSILMERNTQITGRPGGQGMEGQGIAAIDGSPWLPSFGIPRFPHLGIPPPAPVTKL